MTKTGIQATETSTPFSLGSTGASTQLNFNGQGKNSSESSAPKMKRGLDDGIFITFLSVYQEIAQMIKQNLTFGNL